MTTNDHHDMEALAAQEHKSWSGWTKWMLNQMEADSGDSNTFARLLSGLDCVHRWRRQMDTTYSELSEREKESDRKVVREKLALYRGKTQLLRSSVEILVWNDSGQLLTVTNRKWGGFSCPGGKVDSGEEFLAAARRELLEETGCMTTMIQEFAGGIHYDEPQDGGPPWFCLAFKATIENEPSQQEEGTEIGWHTPKQLVEESIYPDWYRFLFKLMPEVEV